MTNRSTRHEGRSLPPTAVESTPKGRIDRLLLRVVDAGLAATIVFVPLAMGGRTALGQLLLVALAAGIAACWCLRQGLSLDRVWIRSPAGWLVLGVLGLLGLQTVPLPASWLARLSPRVYEILPLWAPHTDGSATLGLWKTLSLAPAVTRDGFVVVLAFGLLFLTVVQRVRQPGDVERLLRWVSLAALIMAFFALVQFFCGNGKFFWFFEHPFTKTNDVKGSFSNRNHFADFMALGIGPWTWWIYTTWRRAPAGGAAASFGRKRSRSGAWIGLLAVGLAVVVFAGILSLSRGGIAAMLVAALACLLIVHRIHRINRKMLLALAGTAALIAACLVIYGYQSVATRLADFSSVEQLDREHGRRKIWEADLKATADFPAVGAGLGTHAEVYPRYLPEDQNLQFFEYTHAENGYVQIGLEAGIPGLVLLATAIGLCAWWCVPVFRGCGREQVALCFAGVAPVLLASAVHSATDFVWYVPGCMVAPVVLAACACRLRQMADPRRKEAAKRGDWPRSRWIAAALALLGIGVMSAQNRALALRAEPAWNRYLQAASHSGPLDQIADWQTLQSMQEDLTAVVREQPDHARAHLKLAAVHLRMFDCAPESIAMAEDVRWVRGEASHFKSVAEMNQWLTKALGARRGHLDAAAWHARRALALCPLQGEAYLELAEISFLDGPSAPGKVAYIDQALRVRPFDGAILFAAGQEAASHENYPFPKAFQFWRASFQAGSIHQERLIHALGMDGKAPAATLIDLLQPGLDGLKRFVVYYQDHPIGDNLTVALEQYVKACYREAGAKPTAEAVEDWFYAGNTYGNLHRYGEAIPCLRAAIRYDPLCFKARLLLGSCLLETKDYGEAVTALQWCVQRNSQEPTARDLLERAMDGQLRSKTPTSVLSAERASEPGLH